ncbi:MAG: SDR family NAD(P)-dependent oxidoreductase [Pseudomonadota bacterium]
MKALLKAGNTAVITGGANGIGLAAAKTFARAGMNVCIADVDAEQLDAAMAELKALAPAGEIASFATDVADHSAVVALKDAVFERFGAVNVLMNNAGIGAGGGAYSNLEGWQKVMAVNLWGIIHGVQTFVPAMLEQGEQAVVINTGSKQGITNPPGNAAYNVAKAGVRALTESLAHELRNVEGGQLTAHLLVPGFTYTGLIARHVAEKPPAAWTPEQVVEYMLDRIDTGDFYVLCPDNDVSVALDHKRIQWNTDDLIENRPALSRWHPDFADAFARFVE